MINLVYIHLFFILATLTLVIWADHLALNWLRGKTDTLNKNEVSRIHVFVWLGLVGIISTGILMVYPDWEYYFTHPPFLVKMGFVSMLLINACLIGRLSRLTTTRSFQSLEQKTKIMILFSGGVSTIGWLGALITAKIFL